MSDSDAGLDDGEQEEVVEAPPSLEPPAAPSASHTMRAAGWGVADQGIYSLTNLGLTFLVASSVSAAEFGAFAAIYVCYLVVYGLVDGSVGEVFTIEYSGTRRSQWRPALRAAAGATLALSLVVTAACLLVIPFVGGSFGEALLAFALVLPALLLQALWRTAFFAAGDPRGAVANDLVWAVAQLGALALVLTDGRDSIGWLVGAWGFGALVGAVVGMFQLSVLPHPARAWAWLHEHHALGLRFSGEFFILYGSSQIVLLALGPLAGLAEVGALRGAQVLFGPVQALLLSMRFALRPIYVRTQSAAPGRLPRVAAVTSAALVVLCLGWGIALLAMPTEVGEALLGESWEGARVIIPAMTMQVVALAALFGPFNGLRARADASATLRIGAFTALSGLVLGLAGAATEGAQGAQWGVSVAVAVGGVRLWHRFLATERLAHGTASTTA
jgi:O-antigen/teichoic acid export membrane protein